MVLCVYIPTTDHDNNAHCLAISVYALAGAMFASYGAFNQKQRMKEFLVVKFNVVCRRHYIEALN